MLKVTDAGVTIIVVWQLTPLPEEPMWISAYTLYF